MFSTVCAYLQKNYAVVFPKLFLQHSFTSKWNASPQSWGTSFMKNVDGFPSVADCSMVCFKETLCIYACISYIPGVKESFICPSEVSFLAF